MTKIVAIDYDAGKALFQVRSIGVIVDINERDVERTCSIARALTASSWMKVASDLQYPDVWRELAEAAVTELEVREKTSETPSERKFRIPLAVKAEAQQAIDWATAFERGATPVALAVAKQLTRDNYISFTKMQRLARYFSRRPQSIMENSGWNDGEQGYPTDDRIKYSLWGGEPAREWIDKVAKNHALLAAAPSAEGLPAAETDGPVPDDGDADLDGNLPHDYVEDPDVPEQCLVCGREQDDDIHTGVVASAFEFDGSCEYFGKGIQPDSTVVDSLYMHRADGTWATREANAWVDVDEPSEDTILIMLDEESAHELAQIIDDVAPEDPDVLPFELTTLYPQEAALFYAAEAELDYELIDRVFDIYDSTERSINAKKQVRGPGGRFGDQPDDPDSKKSEGAGETKARLPQALPLVQDIQARIAQYLADVAKKRGAAAPDDAEGEDSAEDGPVMAAADPGTVTDVRPLYLAIVDSVDTEAVLDVISLVPPAAGTQGDVVVWKRHNGTWNQADDLLASLRSVSPPPVVELTDDAILQDVLDQVDKATADNESPNEGEAPAPTTPEAPAPDANPDQHPVSASLSRRGFALPDGSFTILDVEDLRTALGSFDTAKNKNLARTHIIKRARALNRLDLLPKDWDKNERETGYAMWGPQGEILSLAAAAEGGADRNRGNAEELRRYWTKGEGAVKIGWNTPGDWYRCVSQLSRYLGPRAKGYCSLRHKEVTGHWPGDEENR